MITLSYDSIMAAGGDAGDVSMKCAGRAKWNDEDHITACEVTTALFRLLDKQLNKRGRAQ